MPKALLASVMLVTVIVSTWAARDPSAIRGAKRMAVLLLAFNLLYVAGVAFVFARRYLPEYRP